jgi:hypothetical protein
MVVLSIMSLPVGELAQTASIILAAGAPVWHLLKPRLQQSGHHLAEAAYDRLADKVGGWLGKSFGTKDDTLDEAPEVLAEQLEPTLAQDADKALEVETILMQLVNQNAELLKVLQADYQQLKMTTGATIIGTQIFHGDVGKVLTAQTMTVGTIN